MQDHRQERHRRAEVAATTGHLGEPVGAMDTGGRTGPARSFDGVHGREDGRQHRESAAQATMDPSGAELCERGWRGGLRLPPDYMAGGALDQGPV